MPWYSSPLSRLCGILALSGYRKRTLHFRLLPMVKCPLDCFLVYSFLLDVELAKIRHAPFGIFAFSDKPLRNPSEHSGFWYIQGRIFSSCGLSETQGLPRSLVRFRAHRGDVARTGPVFVQQAPTTSTIPVDFLKNPPTNSNSVHESCVQFWSQPFFDGA